jgi:acetolactate synthase-1/2/3 large subunit
VPNGRLVDSPTMTGQQRSSGRLETALRGGAIDVADAIVAALADLGISHVLGIPGGYTGGVFSALHDDPDIDVVQVREESLGSYMAEAHGRYTGRPLVVMGQGEWIVGNAGQGYLEALLGSSPLLILTEMSEGGPLSHHAPYQGGSGDYGSWDTRRALEGLTKRVMVSHYPAQAVQHVQLAYKHAVTGDPGPVAVIFHGDALKGQVDQSTKPRLYGSSAYVPTRSAAVDDRAIEATVTALNAAERPVVVAGNGIRVGQACAELLELAETLDIPIATTASGKGVVDETHPLSLGVIGTFGHGPANAVVGTADFVLAVGTRLAPLDTGDENLALLDPDRQFLAQVDIEPLHTAWTYPVDVQIVADARTALQALTERTSAGARGGSERVAAAVANHGELDGGEAISDEVPMTPQRIIRAVGECFPSDGIVTCDAGENRLFMMHWHRNRLAGGYLQPAAGGGMGYAVPAAMGARIADPDRPILAVCGDGGFAMSMHGLMTALQERLPIAVLVFNNNALGWVLHGMGEQAVAAGFDDFDHAAIAQAMGCDGIRVRSPQDLEEGLRSVADITRPLVIDVPTSLKASFKDIVQPLASNRWKDSD